MRFVVVGLYSIYVCKNSFVLHISMVQQDMATFLFLRRFNAFMLHFSVERKITVCLFILQILATGNFFHSLRFNYRIGFATVKIIVEKYVTQNKYGKRLRMDSIRIILKH